MIYKTGLLNNKSIWIKYFKARIKKLELLIQTKKELVSIYKVNYIDEGQAYEAQYFENGEWIRTFTEIKQTSLPTIITNQLFNLYPDYRILKSLIELNNDGKFYTLSLVRGKDAITIYFTMSGRFVK